MSEQRPNGFAVKPRTLAIMMLVVIVIAAAAVWWLLRADSLTGATRFTDLSEDSTATAGFAGMFPPDDTDPLANPLGIVWDGDALYVAESDAARIAVFAADGEPLGTIGIASATGAPACYPSSLAVAGEGRLAVVDNAAPRVIVVSTAIAEEAEVLATLGEDGEAPQQPTAVAYADGEFFVFDASIAAVRVYDEDGRQARVIGEALEPRLTYASGLAATDGVLYVADSNGGRVLVLDPDSGEQRAVFGDRYALPRGIVVLREGELAIVDTFEQSVHLADADGDRVFVIGADTMELGAPSSPRDGAWVDADERLYVTDAARGRVLVYNVRRFTQ